MKLEIGNKNIKDLTSDNLYQILLIIGCTPALEYWNEPIITEFNNTMFSDTIVVDYHSFRKEDNLKSQEFTLFFNFERFSYHYTNEFQKSQQNYKPNGQRVSLDIIKYLIKEGYDIPIY